MPFGRTGNTGGIMKKALALILSSAMLVTTVAGLTACKKPKKPDDTVPEITRLTDPRAADAFEVHAKNGTLVGTYRSIAAAINAAVENDLDDFEVANVPAGTRGSYVTKKGSTRKIFENMTQNEAGIGDYFWYYSNNSLSGFEPYETGVPYLRGQNAKDIAYKVSATYTSVAASNFGVYDGLGQPLSTTDIDVGGRAWEIVESADASIRGIPVREMGATGARYTLDLSEVQIKPAYDGVEDNVYAYFGMTAGSGTYSVDIGLACDVNTGLWKQYVSHNPHNNRDTVTVEYNIGETVFNSTWNAEGGYFTPNVDSVTLEIKEVKDEDDLGEEYWYNKLVITAEGKSPITFIIDDEFLVKYGNPGATYDTKNGFYFSAGLDIVAKGAQIGDEIAAPDYTNGATFENLTVSKGEIYFPDEDEISDADYGALIDPTLKGEYHNIRTETYKGVTRGIYNYTLVLVNACVDYEIVDGLDTYSFRYDNYEVPTSDFAGVMKTNQDKIDELKGITVANAATYKDKIAEVEALYHEGVELGGDIPAYAYRYLDWTPLTNAQKIFKEAISLSDEAQALLDEFNTLSNINLLSAWKGWKAPAGTADTKGYLYNELQTFKGYNARFAELGSDDRSGIAQLVGDKWDVWALLEDELDTIDNSGAEFATKEFTLPSFDLNSTETLTGLELVDEFFNLAYTAYVISAEEHTDHGGALCVEIPGDGIPGASNTKHFYNTLRLFYVDRLIAKNVELDYTIDMITMLGDTHAASKGSYQDYQYIAAVCEQLQRIASGECAYLDEELADVVNKYMVTFPGFQNGTFIWSYKTYGELISYGNIPWKLYFGSELEAKSAELKANCGSSDSVVQLKASGLAALINSLLMPIITRDAPGATLVPVSGAAENSYGFAISKTVTAVVPELSTEAQAWLAAWNAAAIPDLTDLSVNWVGWQNYDAGIGVMAADAEYYLYDELVKFEGLYETYSALSALDRRVLMLSVNEASLLAWAKLSEQYAAVLAGSFKTTEYTIGEMSFTGEDLIAEMFYNLYAITGEHFNTGDDNYRSFLAMAMYTVVSENAPGSIDYLETLVGKLGEATYLDAFEYYYNVLTQAKRVAAEEMIELDYELAVVINKYMVDATGTKALPWTDAVALEIAVDLYGFYTATSFADVVEGMLALATAEEGVTLNSNGYSINKDVPVPEQTTFSAKDVIAAYNALALSDLANYEAWYGWASTAGTTKGYVNDELTMFLTVLEKYETITSQSGKEAVQAAAGWTAWEALADEIATIEADTDSVTIWDTEYTAQDVEKSKLEVLALAIDGVFYAKRENKVETAQGYFDQENHAECSSNGIYALYLTKVLEEEGVELAWLDRMLTALKSVGNDFVSDFDYVWYVGKQIIRVMNGLNYIDEELAEVVNTYMYTTSGKNNFNNGTWSYFYRTGGGIAPKIDPDWVKAIGVELFTADIATTDYYRVHWSVAMNYLTGSKGLLRAYRDSFVAVDSFNPMYLTEKVEAGEPPVKGDLTTPAGIVTEFKNLDLSDLTNPREWKGATKGSSMATYEYGYIFDEVAMFEELYNAYKELASGAEQVLAEVPEFEAWVNLYEQVAAVKADTDQVTIFNAIPVDGSVVGTVTTAKYNVMVAFFRDLMGSYDSSLAHATNNSLHGYLCMEHKDHMLLSLRVLNLYAFITDEANEFNFPFAAQFFNAAVDHASNGISKYINMTQSRGAVKDYEYLVNVAKLINILAENPDAPLEGEVKTIIDTYMLATGTYDAGDSVGVAGTYGTYESFYNLSLSTWYRRDGRIGLVGTNPTEDFEICWMPYVGIDVTDAKFEGKSWGDLMQTYFKPYIEKHSDEYTLVPPRSGSSPAMVVKETPKATAKAQEVIKAFDDLHLSDPTSVSPEVWKGGYKDGETKGYLYDEVLMFKEVYEEYADLSQVDQTAVLNGTNGLFDKWLAVLDMFESLDDETEIAIVGADYTDTTATELEMVIEFFDNVFASYEDDMENRKAASHNSNASFGYLCMEDKAHFEKSMRALYLNMVIAEKIDDFTFVADKLEKIALYGNGNGTGDWATDKTNTNYVSKYTGYTEAQNAIKDFNYLVVMAEQIKRIKDGNIETLDNTLRAALNQLIEEYMIQGLMTSYADKYGCANSFYNLSLSTYFRENYGDAGRPAGIEPQEIGLGTNWERYLGLGTDKTWAELLATYINPLLAGEYNVVALGAGQVGMMYTNEGLDVVKAYKALGLSNLNTYADWKGWKSENGNTKGYVYDELQMFLTVVDEFEALAEANKALVLEQIPAWTQWEALAEDIAALEADTATVTIWDSAFAGDAESLPKTKLEIFELFIDGAFWAKKTGNIDATQGYLCVEHELCAVNTMYTLYLNTVLQEEEVSVAYYEVVWNTLKNEGSGIALDFEYILKMSEQAVRILDGLNYLDEELAAAVNKYMHISSVPAGNSFRNGTWSWAYRANWFKGGMKKFGSSYWIKILDPKLFTMMNTNDEGVSANEFYWFPVISLINDILIEAGYGDNLIAVATTGGNAAYYANDCVPMYINCEVEAQQPKPSLEATVESVVAGFNALQLSDLSNPRAWMGGYKDGNTKGYIYDEVLMFNEIYAFYKQLDSAKQAEVCEQVAVFAKWAALSDAYAALVADETKYDIVNGNGTEVLATTVSVTGLSIVNGYFNAALATYDGATANSKGNLYGYLCLEHKEHFLLSMRALYLHKLIGENNINFPFADEMLNAMAKLESTGTSKYTGYTETEGAIKDFDYLWTMAQQIKRIKDGNVTALDDTLRAAIEKLMEDYMVVTTESAYAGAYGCVNYFYNLSLATRYRDYNEIGSHPHGDPWDVGTTWLRYFGLDGTESWAELLATYVNPLLTGEYDFVTGENNRAPIHYKKKASAN